MAQKERFHLHRHRQRKRPRDILPSLSSIQRSQMLKLLSPKIRAMKRPRNRFSTRSQNQYKKRSMMAQLFRNPRLSRPNSKMNTRHMRMCLMGMAFLSPFPQFNRISQILTQKLRLPLFTISTHNPPLLRPLQRLKIRRLTIIMRHTLLMANMRDTVRILMGNKRRKVRPQAPRRMTRSSNSRWQARPHSMTSTLVNSSRACLLRQHQFSRRPSHRALLLRILPRPFMISIQLVRAQGLFRVVLVIAKVQQSRRFHRLKTLLRLL